MKHETDPIFERPLPANAEAERFVLAEALSNRRLENITASLSPEDFSTEANRRVFAGITHLDSAGTPVDRVTLAEELQRRGQLESVGGLSYLISLDEGMPEVVNIDAYVSIMRDKAILRHAIRECHLAIEDCYAAADPTPEILDRAERAIAALGGETQSAGFRSPMEVVNRAGGITAFLDPDRRRGIPTPWAQLNGMLEGRGFLPGQMVVIGARPSMGKTALACQIADFAASHGTGTAFFTLEMPDRAILLRIAAARAQVDGLRVSQGWANETEIRALNEAFADLTDDERCRLWIDDKAGCTVPAMRGALRRLTARHPIGLVLIDYLQLVETSGGSERRRYEQVTDISRGIKRLAREFDATVVVLAQLNRESEKDGASRKPHPSQLRDSGSIEQDADVILMPARQERQTQHSDVLGIELIIAKQRNGPLGFIPLQFLKRYAKFIELGSKTGVHVEGLDQV